VIDPKVNVSSTSAISAQVNNHLPILKKQAGFVDETLLVSDIEPNQILALSFWNSKEDAERYQREQYPAIHQMVRHLLEAEPVIRAFNVDSSTTHRIAPGKAA
jgi:heme-degrading monooxygenase HmoA